MAWLTRDAEVLAAVESWSRGCLGRDHDGAVVARRRHLVVGSRSRPLDVAWCRPVAAQDPGQAEAEEVVEVRRVRRVAVVPALPSWRTPVLIVAADGAFERWHLAVGDRLAIHGE